MPKSGGMSVAELEQLLHSRKRELEELISERRQLQANLKEVDQKIAGLQGKSRRGAKRGPRPKNDRSLFEYVKEALSKSKKGLSLKDLEDKVLESGYKTNSKNFKTVLYQCVYSHDEVGHDATTGTYRIQSQ